MEKITIRKATLEDTRYIAELTCKLAETSEDLDIDVDICNGFVERGMKEFSHLMSYNIVMIGEGKDQQRAAYYTLNFEDNPFVDESFIWLRSIVVNDEFRGQGIFRKCFNIIKEKAKNEGYLGVRLYVHRESKTAYQIYLKYGFVLDPVKNMEVDTVYNSFENYAQENIEKNVEEFREKFTIAARFSQENRNEEQITLLKVQKGEAGLEQLESFSEEIGKWESILGKSGISENLEISETEKEKISLKEAVEQYIGSQIHNSLFLLKQASKIVGMFLMINEFCDCSGGFSCWITDCYLQSSMVDSDEMKVETIARINLAILEVKKDLDIVQWNWLTKEDLKRLEGKLEGQGMKDFGDDVMTYYL